MVSLFLRFLVVVVGLSVGIYAIWKLVIPTVVNIGHWPFADEIPKMAFCFAMIMVLKWTEPYLSGMR